MENIFTIYTDMSNLAFCSLVAVVGNILWYMLMIGIAIREYEDEYEFRHRGQKCFRDFLKQESTYLYLCLFFTFMSAEFIMISWLLQNE